LLRRVYAPPAEAAAPAEAPAPAPPLPRGRDLGGIDDGAGDGPAGSGPMTDDERPRGRAEHMRRRNVPDVRLTGAFGEGFGLRTDDEEYQLRFRVLDQTDFKVFSPNDQVPASSGIYIPRVRIYMEGQLTRLFQYEVSIQRSVEGVWDLLDGNVDVNIDPRFKLKFGRTLVPYSYDWYDHLEQWFITPERSLFPLNFGLSRSAGLLAHGRLLDDRLQYAVGGFDGHLVGVADNNSTRDAVGYINFKPFANSDRWRLLKNLNFGVSGYLGQQVRPQRPLPMRTSLQSSENDEAAQQATSLFLAFNEDAYLLGGHSALAAHIAWYVGGLSFEAEWQGGRDHYNRADAFNPVSVPVKGNHFTASYFLTGEQVVARRRVDPLRPYDPVHNAWGPGAFEPFARYSSLSLGDAVFKAGLADPNVWTRSIGLTDVGLNWYPTSFIKVYFDWQHSMYGSPVQLNKDHKSSVNDLFWIRGQLYY
jgi:phosphate-selective porin OprO/OprP